MSQNYNDIPILKILSARERQVFLKWSDEKFFKKDEIIFKKGDKRKDFLVILNGQVEIVNLVAESEDIFDILESGDFITETALFEPGTYHTLSARAKTDVFTLNLNYQSFNNLEKEDPAIVLKILKYVSVVLSERLHHADNKLLVLYHTGKILGSSFDLEKDGRKILSAILQVIAAEKAFLAILAFDKIYIKTAVGYHKNNPTGQIIEINKSDILLDIMAQKQTMIIKRDSQFQIKDTNDWHQSSLWSGSMILTPVMSAGNIKAIIVLLNKQTGEFNVNNKILLEAVADQLAASLALKEASEYKRAEEELKRIYY